MSQAKKHVVTLTAAERKALTRFVSRGAHKARAINRARVLLLADEGHPDAHIVDLLGLSRGTVSSIRKKYNETPYGHILDLLPDAPRQGRPLKVDSRVEAQISLLACSDPPEGVAKWTLRLLADRLVALEHIDSISHQTVGVALKKTN